MRMCLENPQSESASGRRGGGATAQDAVVTGRGNDGKFFILNALPNYAGVYADESEHKNVYGARGFPGFSQKPRDDNWEPNLLI